ncbi:STN domain-containing protein [Hyphomicrobium sp. 2TAF46]|uniref:STN domain-containing protein n=1 Tax=Hyphomicrobium sp. 2TAF46 TaxID=3233019 RepID=UPI003F8E8339
MLGPVAPIAAQVRSVWLCRTLASLLWGAAAIYTTTISAAAQTANPHAEIAFDIAAQPLASALDTYVAMTGLGVLYDAGLAAGRRSKAVRGILAADVALRVLLEGTGLTVLYTRDAFSVVPAPAWQPSGKDPGGQDYLPYFGMIQRGIEEAFCREAVTVPGDYRLAVQFRVDGSGKVLQPQLLTTTGSSTRDTAIANLLQTVTIGSRPPRGMPQPVTLLVIPRAPQQTGDCRQNSSQSYERAAR